MNLEDILQAEFVRWFNNNYCLKHHFPRGIIFSIPNGGLRTKVEAKVLQATGLLPGASDVVIIYNSKILFLELKNEDGVQSPAQKDFQQRLESNGFHYDIAYSLEEAQKKTRKFFGL